MGRANFDSAFSQKASGPNDFLLSSFGHNHPSYYGGATRISALLADGEGQYESPGRSSRQLYKMVACRACALFQEAGVLVRIMARRKRKTRMTGVIMRTFTERVPISRLVTMKSAAPGYNMPVFGWIAVLVRSALL